MRHVHSQLWDSHARVAVLRGISHQTSTLGDQRPATPLFGGFLSARLAVAKRGLGPMCSRRNSLRNRPAGPITRSLPATNSPTLPDSRTHIRHTNVLRRSKPKRTSGAVFRHVRAGRAVSFAADHRFLPHRDHLRRQTVSATAPPAGREQKPTGRRHRSTGRIDPAHNIPVHVPLTNGKPRCERLALGHAGKQDGHLVNGSVRMEVFRMVNLAADRARTPSRPQRDMLHCCAGSVSAWGTDRWRSS